jgi:hypothetical protein
MKKLFFSLVLILFTVAGFSQPDSSRLRISLLTCTPGSELYSVFGHNALRIVDSAASTDVVYNFGTFNFDDPNFYSKFVLGKLMYFLSQEYYPDFVFSYKYYGRGITEQVLDLNGIEKKQIQLELFNNISEENRYYKYDFLYDNCSTRLRDIIFQQRDNVSVEFPVLNSKRLTFRDHLHGYLDRAEMQWTKLGIDLLLGIGADKVMSDAESMFLPDHLATGVGLATRSGKQLVKEDHASLQDEQPSPTALAWWLTPLFFFSLFALMVVSPVFLKGKDLRKYQLVMDRIMFISTGLLGCLLMFMWFGTDHQSFSNNVSIAWAMPFNLVVGFILPSSRSWVKYYLKFYGLFVLLILVLAMFSICYINVVLFPMILAISLRSWLIGRSNTI